MYQWEAQEVEERQGREAVAAAESAAEDEGVEEERAEGHQGGGRVLFRSLTRKNRMREGRDGGQKRDGQ